MRHQVHDRSQTRFEAVTYAAHLRQKHPSSCHLGLSDLRGKRKNPEPCQSPPTKIVPPPVAPLLPDYELQGRDPYGPGTTFPAKFVIYEETSTGTYAICVVLERLISHSSSAEIISKIPGNTFRNVPVTPQDNLIEALPSNWTQIDDVNRMPVGTLSPKLGRIREICDPWNRRIAVIFPGREAR